LIPELIKFLLRHVVVLWFWRD